MQGWQVDRNKRARGGAEFALPGAQLHYPPDLSLEPTHLVLAVSVDIPERTLSGTVTTSVTARRGGPRTLTLDAVSFEELGVEDADGKSLDWRYDGRKLCITWRDEFAAGETRRVAVTYRVTNPITGLFFSSPDDAYPEAPVFAVTDHETERARFWLPCIDHPNARPTLEWYLTADADHEILANGTLVSLKTENGRATAHWKLDARCPSYLTCFALGDFTRAEDGEFEGRPIAYFAPRRFSAEDLKRSFGRTGKMMAWLTEKLGAAFPYPKYYQFAVPLIGGAMENISLVSWDDRFVLDETLAKEWRFLLDQINIHEMSHSYFGDWIVCRDFAHAWLKESWATYIETCWLEDNVSLDEAHYDFFVDAQLYFREADESYKRPLVTRRFSHSWDMYDYHLYPGGACRLHTLRNYLGDDVFWAGVRDYVQTFGDSVVETEDFRRTLERHSGRPLAKFFDQWIYSPGYPDLKVKFEFDAEKKRATFQITQEQASVKEGATGEPEIAFAFDLEIVWEIGGKQTRQVVEISKAAHTVVIPMSAEPDRLVVDPKGKVLHKQHFNSGSKRLRSQLTDAAAIPRIRAGWELAETGERANLEAIGEAWANESFWGVKVQWARAIAKSGSQRAIAILCEVAANEQDPMVLEPLFRALQGFRDPMVADVLAQRLDEGVPYRAAQAAYEVLGSQREAAPIERLQRAVKEDGFGAVAAAGAARGLGQSRHAEALETLLSLTPPGLVSQDLRPALATALGILGKHGERPDRVRIREHLADLLRDTHPWVRRAAMLALGAMDATGATAELDAYRNLLCEQDQVEVLRLVAGLLSTDEPAKLTKRIETLEGKLRKLEDVVRVLEAEKQAAAEQAVFPKPATPPTVKPT